MFQICQESQLFNFYLNKFLPRPIFYDPLPFHYSESKQSLFKLSVSVAKYILFTEAGLHIHDNDAFDPMNEIRFCSYTLKFPKKKQKLHLIFGLPFKRIHIIPMHFFPT